MYREQAKIDMDTVENLKNSLHEKDKVLLKESFEYINKNIPKIHEKILNAFAKRKHFASISVKRKMIRQEIINYLNTKYENLVKFELDEYDSWFGYTDLIAKVDLSKDKYSQSKSYPSGPID